MGQNRRKFTKEFKLEAVRLLTESGRSLKQVAEDLDVSATTRISMSLPLG